MKPVSFQIDGSELRTWPTDSDPGWWLKAVIAEGKSAFLWSRITVRYDNDQSVAFRRRSPAPINQQPEDV